MQIKKLMIFDWTYTFIYTFFTYVFPFLFAIHAYNEDATIRIWVNIAFFIITTVFLQLLKGNVRKAVLVVLLLLAFLPNIIVLSFLLMDNTIMKSTDFWVVFDTNLSEATGFITTLPFQSFVWCIIYILTWFISLILTWKHEPNYYINKNISLISIFLMICVMFCLPFRAKVPSIDFYKSFVNYQKEKIEVRRFFERRKDLKIEVQSFLPSGKKTIIIAIGESQTRNHMQLYGYPRLTNPMLSEIIGELIIYEDICSPSIQTLTCMKQILTFANYENLNQYKEEASIVELAKNGGYYTYWIDNQGSGRGIDTYTPTSYRTIAHMCDYYSDENESPMDSMILRKLDKILQDTVESKVVFLHLIGSHFPYCSHYEQNYNVFDNTSVPSKFCDCLSSNQIKILNEYDNSILYNDYILRQIIEMLRKQDGMSAFLYFSDHGEEVFDSQIYAGRSFEKISPSMCQIPLILWFNSMYKQVNTLSLDPSRPACTDDIIHGMMDLLGIKYSLYDSTRSIFSEAFLPKERMVHNYSYDKICNNDRSK